VGWELDQISTRSNVDGALVENSIKPIQTVINVLINVKLTFVRPTAVV
jgi:hypothetical protein